MRSCLVVVFSLLTAASGLARQAVKSADNSVVSVEPPCAEWSMPSAPKQPLIPPHITIRYNPLAPGARLRAAQSITLVLATARGTRFDSITIPMRRTADGLWQADFTPQRDYVPGYSIFLFRDDKDRADTNGGQYWEILNCQNGEAYPWSVEARAATYEGRLLAPGIERQRDLARALAILRNDLKSDPHRYSHYFLIWRYELELGGESSSAYEQVGSELNAFISAYGKEPYALRQIAGFVAPRQKLPPGVVQRYRQAVEELPETAEPVMIAVGPAGKKKVIRVPRDERFRARLQREVSMILAELDYWSVALEQGNLQKKAADYLAFASRYPSSPLAQSAYSGAFYCDKQANNVAGAEAAFEKWTAADSGNPNPLVVMAQFYVDQKIQLDRAIELLSRAAALYQSPPTNMHFSREPGQLEFLRGQAYLLFSNLAAARADFDAAAKAAPGKPDILYSLGKVCEKMGDTAQALKAYLAAASAPYQVSPAPREAYECLFVAQKLGNKQDADQRLASQTAENAQRAASEYTPVAFNRPAPAFKFTDLAGKPFDNESVKGRPTILTFWSVWCAPCVAELPALQEFQKEHPSANLLAIEIGNKPKEVTSFLVSHKLRTLHVALDASWPQGFGPAALPTTIVLDRFGQIQFVHVGLLADVGAILGKDLDALSGPR